VPFENTTPGNGFAAGCPQCTGNDDTYAVGDEVASGFQELEELATDSAGNLYIADGTTFAITKVTPAGVITYLGSIYDDGPGDATLPGGDCFW
jgi:hypothetical protein